MYKVFINDKPIIITSSEKKELNYTSLFFKSVVIDEIIHKLQNQVLNGINLISNNLEKDWKSFLTNFDVLQAAGGLVINPQNEVLFIYRNGKWDLPKGHVEKKESIENAAVREVEEECGIQKLSIIEKLTVTYHIYFLNGIKLKETHWFLMNTNDSKNPRPQLEEGITDVGFRNKNEINELMNNTYSNIKMVFDCYQKTL